MMYTGIDPIDMVQLLKEICEGNFVVITREKTGEMTLIAKPQALRDILAEAPETNTDTICATSRGTPWTRDGLSTSWQKFRAKLVEEGVIGKGLTLKGLRHAMATNLREVGVEKSAIAEFLAQKSDNMAAHYSRDADLSGKMLDVVKKFDASEAKKRTEFGKLGEKSGKLQKEEPSE